MNLILNSRFRIVASLASCLMVGAVLAGCGANGSGYNLDPPNTGFMEDTGPVNPGEPAAYPVYLPKSKVPVTLVSAQLLAIPGFPAPKLIHLGVWYIFHGLTSMAMGLPPHGCGGAAPCNAPGKPFKGFHLKPGDSQELVYFWVQAERPGNYYVGGLRVTYQIGSKSFTGNLYSGGEMCVRVDWRHHTKELDKTCNFSAKADGELTRLSEHSP